MKFGDKLTLLRKRNGLSQEELGDKLNVTRQTISKWELGQTKPDTDKLMEISKLLNVDFNLLIDDSLSLDSISNNNISNSVTGSNVVIDDEVRPRKWLLVVLIIITIGLVIFLLDGYVSNKKSEEEEFFDLFGGFSDLFNEMDFDMGSFDKSSFNSSFEIKTGTKMGSLVSSLLDDVITNNKTNKEHIITVLFGDLNSGDPNEIKNAKKNIETFDDYEVSLDYDNDGYVNSVTIEVIEKEETISQFDIMSFNNKYESFYSGTTNGRLVNDMLDDIITNNKTNKERTIRVIYGNINTVDESEIRNLKKSFGDVWTNYEVILDYDDIGFVNQITIEN